MAYRLIRSPRLLAARGVASLAFGTLTVAWPTMTVATFVGCFAALALLDGALSLFAALRRPGRARDPRGLRDPLLLQGVAGVAIGGLIAAIGDVRVQTLLAAMAVWAAVTGSIQLLLARQGRRRLPGAWFLGGAGAAGVALAVALALALAAGEVRVGWQVAAWGIVVGGLLLMLAWRLHTTADVRVTSSGEPAPTPVPAEG